MLLVFKNTRKSKYVVEQVWVLGLGTVATVNSVGGASVVGSVWAG